MRVAGKSSPSRGAPHPTRLRRAAFSRRREKGAAVLFLLSALRLRSIKAGALSSEADTGSREESASEPLNLESFRFHEKRKDSRPSAKFRCAMSRRRRAGRKMKTPRTPRGLRGVFSERRRRIYAACAMAASIEAVSSTEPSIPAASRILASAASLTSPSPA